MNRIFPTSSGTNVSGDLLKKAKQHIKTGKKLKDTQCGLRFIPRSYFDILLKIKENNFEFELICLFKINFIDVKMIPLKIETIYFKDKKITHYKKIIDTILSINQDSIIFTHFMVMNAVVAYAKQFSKLVNISPDYTSTIKIKAKDSQIISLKVGDQKKTKINI